MSRSRTRRSRSRGRSGPGPPPPPPPPPAPPSHSHSRWPALAAWKPALLVAAVALAASIAGLPNRYALDDTALILDDARLHDFDLGAIFGSPYWPDPEQGELYRPLATFSLAVQWALGGGSPLVFRVVSYLLYAAVSLGVLALAGRLLPAGVALAVALLFAAHPVHVEAVALGVNQGELWVALLGLVATTIYLDARRRGWPLGRDWALLGALYLLACLFKEHAVVIPGFLLAAELTLLRGAAARESLRRLWPGFAALAALGGAFLALRSAVLGSFAGSFTAEALVGQDPWGRTLTMLQVVPEWLRLLLWPAHLQGDYSPAVIEQATRWGWAQAGGAALLLALAALGWRTRRAAPAVAFGLLWSGAALLPVSNIVVPTGIVLAERTLFLPSVGFLLAVGALAAALLAGERIPADGAAAAAERPTRGGAAAGRAPARHTASKRPSGEDAAGTRPTGGQRRIPARILVRVLGVVTVVLVALGTARSAARHRDWRDHFHFWARTVEDAPLSARAHHALGKLLYNERGDLEGAIGAYQRAAVLNPADARIQHELADLFRVRGDCAAALFWYAESLRLDPAQASARLSRIACLMQLGRFEEAAAEAGPAR